MLNGQKLPKDESLSVVEREIIKDGKHIHKKTSLDSTVIKIIDLVTGQESNSIKVIDTLSAGYRGVEESSFSKSDRR